MNIRQEVLKGGCFLNDIIKLITVECNNVEIHVINNAGDFTFPINNNSTCDVIIHNGPISKIEMIDLLKKSDILVDASLSEGFGLLPLEAMTAGVVPVVSNSFGNNEYCKDNENCFLITGVNDTTKYAEKIKLLLNDDKTYEKLQKKAIETSANFDFDDKIVEFKKALDEIDSGRYAKVKDNIRKKDIEILSNYTLSDYAFNHVINTSIRLFAEQKIKDDKEKIYRKSNRLYNFKVILKEFVKANVYLFKLTIKTIINKDFKI